MLIQSADGMAMLRNHIAARTIRFVCSGNSHCARKYFSSLKTFNDIPSIQGAWPIIGHAHLFGPTGMYLQVNDAALISYGVTESVLYSQHKETILHIPSDIGKCETDLISLYPYFTESKS
jgi:hypothetical protein